MLMASTLPDPTEVESSTRIASLRSHIQSVLQLHEHLHTFRQVPLQLLRPPATTNDLPSQHILKDFQKIKTFKETLRSEPIQAALRSARDSEKADKSDLKPTTRRQNLKRRRPSSPSSPKPYLSSPLHTESLFPGNGHHNPLRPEDLPDYIRSFNKSHQSKLHIWARTRPAPQTIAQPVIVRFTVPDVLTVFMTLGHGHNLPALVIETVTAFGPRERVKFLQSQFVFLTQKTIFNQKATHSKSDYATYQDLSQQLAKMVHSHPRVSFQVFMDFLCSYEGIFVDQCTSCERVLSLETHVPPVARVWIDSGKDGGTGSWHPRHVTCIQN